MIRIFNEDNLIVDYNKEIGVYIFSFFYDGHFVTNYVVNGNIHAIKEI